MPRYEYRPRPNKDPRNDCIRAGWRTQEDLLVPESAEFDPALFNTQIERLRERIDQGQLDGTWVSAFSRPIFDVEKTSEGETLLLAQTIGANTILYFADVHQD